jgi:GT2 family glycosyltransferase
VSASTWIVLVDYNGLEDTRKCLASLARQTDPAQVVVIDNASRQEVGPALAGDFPGVHFVRNKVNGGWAGGNNAGIEYALKRGAELVVLLNNDTTVAPHFVARLERAANDRPRFGVLGPVIYFMDEPAEVMTDGCVFNRPDGAGFFQRLAVPVAPADPPTLTEVDVVNGCCMMIRREVFERIGLIDERFFLIHEESDFCLRARRAGFPCGILAEGLVWHKGSSSFKRSGRGWQRYYDARNLLLLLRKHQTTHQSGRGPWRSRLEYVKYLYYRYCVEREEAQPEAAQAVLRGLNDALLGRWGPYDVRLPRPAVPLLQGIFDFWRARKRTDKAGR